MGLIKNYQKKKELLGSTFFSSFSDLDSINKDKEEEEEEKLIIVFDLGGGTFDVTLLKMVDEEIFDVLATSGDSHLGGDDFDKKIIDFCLSEFCSKLNIKKDEIEKDRKAMNRLKIASEKLKLN